MGQDKPQETQLHEITLGLTEESQPKVERKSINAEDLKGIKICRNCQEETHQEDMIHPCNCSGSIFWVHRKCLDEWRAVSPNVQSVTHCDVCQFEYEIEIMPKDHCCQKMKFSLLVLRDFTILFLGFFTMTVLFGVFVWLCDFGDVKEEILPNSPEYLQCYVAGLLLFLATMGALTLVALFIRFIACCLFPNQHDCWLCCCFPAYSYNTYHYGYDSFFFYWWFILWSSPIGGPHYGAPTGSAGRRVGSSTSGCPGCDCVGCTNCNGCPSGGGGGCNCNGGGDGMHIVILVICVILIVIGAVVLAIVIVFVTLNIVRKHWTVLRKKLDSEELQVKDLSKDYSLHV